ncbi:hypothetical protein PC116_g23563 [Phytophthora cactorum]|nr:hypothetical protein PC119_g8547 [Phytophthora cactorum]KAG3139555.1 hypothetical protein C6341_g20311 [Phytophthora cactorum]KAG4043594.1 hypothetical protein PC123_g20936 [Phytophthora cactorum]KAG4228073.1 hypothetical protein PC116_g23563 [Phytophthora cactorum]
MITDVKRGCGTGRVILINAGLLAGVLMLEARSSKLVDCWIFGQESTTPVVLSQRA